MIQIPNGHLTDEEQEALFVLRSDPWSRRSSKAVAKYLGCKTSMVDRLRERYNLVPTFIERVDHRTGKTKLMLAKNIGRKVRRLNEKQQKLVEDALPDAQREARSQANGVLDEGELIGIAHEALEVAAVYWNPDKDMPDKEKFWKVYAYRGVMRAFGRAFKIARTRQSVVSLLRDGAEFGDDEVKKLEDFGAPEERDTMMDRFHGLRGITRLTVEWIAGLSAPGPRSAEHLANFWEISLDVVNNHLLVEAREAMEA